MKLVTIPPQQLNATAQHWAPFIEEIARGQRCHITQRLHDIYSGQVQLFVAWNEETGKVEALAGVTLMVRGDDRVGRIVWTTGEEDRTRWQDLYHDIEKFCRHRWGCVGMEAVARPGWSKQLKEWGFRLRHVIYEKDFPKGNGHG